MLKAKEMVRKFIRLGKFKGRAKKGQFLDVFGYFLLGRVTFRFVELSLVWFSYV